MIESDIAVGAALRITCTKEDLVQGLSIVGRAVSTRTAIQILSGILLEARGEDLRLAATDMELSLRATVSARVEGDGAVVLPGRTLVDIARLLPGDDVTIEHSAAESVVHIASGSASYTLHTHNAEDFPRLPELTDTQTFEIDREALLETIGRVARAASRDEARPVLTGVLVQFTGGKLVMAATDSYRLAVKETTLGSRYRSSRVSPAARMRSPSECRRTRFSSRSEASGSRRAGSTASSRTIDSSCPRPSSTS